MAKAELGMKLTCESCGARFYDLNKQPGICPKCGQANARPVIFKASRRPAEDREKAAAAKAAAAPAPVADEDDVAVDTDDDDEDEAVIEDTSDLGEDDDVDVPVEKDADV